MASQLTTAIAQTYQYLDRAFTLSGPSEAEVLYDEWADTYDSGTLAAGYASPRRCVETIVKYISSPDSSTKLAFFDAGCGTGMVGDCLAQSSLAKNFVIDGVDISPGMLEAARKKGIYRELRVADLNDKLVESDAAYNVLACVGTLTKGHVGPQILDEFARLTKTGGLIVVTVHGEVWEADGYKTAVEELQSKGLVKVAEITDFGITEDAESGAIMVVLKRE